MQNLIDIFSILCSIDSDKSTAGLVAGLILGGVIVVCVMALVFKKILLNRKYHEDETYVKEYRKKMKEKETENQKKSGLIQENF